MQSVYFFPNNYHFFCNKNVLISSIIVKSINLCQITSVYYVMQGIIQIINSSIINKPITMKKSVFNFGLLLSVLTTTTVFAFEGEQQQTSIEEASGTSALTALTVKPEVGIETQEELQQTIRVIASNYCKSEEEIAEEGREITETTLPEEAPLFFDNFILEQEIETNAAIIEADQDFETRPLDFGLIEVLSQLNRQATIDSKIQ